MTTLPIEHADYCEEKRASLEQFLKSMKINLIEVDGLDGWCLMQDKPVFMCSGFKP